jgi:DNA-binding transcriptional LysR family regulator
MSEQANKVAIVTAHRAASASGWALRAARVPSMDYRPRNGKTRRISVHGQAMVNDADLATRAAVDGLGIALTVEALAEPFLRSGQLVQVLEDWSPSFEGFFVYYPGHRQVPASLRAFIDMLRDVGGSSPARSSLKNPFTGN